MFWWTLSFLVCSLLCSVYGRYTPKDDPYPLIDNQYSSNDNQYSSNDNQYSSNDNQHSSNDNQYSSNDNQYIPSHNQYSSNDYQYKSNQYGSNDNRFVTNNNQYVSNDNQYAQTDNKYIPTESQYAPNDNQYAVNDNQYAANDNQYVANDNQYVANDNQYKSSDNQHALNNNQYPSNDYQYRSSNDQYSSNARVYDLQVPGSNPIRIIEAEEPLWRRNRIFADVEHRDVLNLNADEATTETSKPFLVNPIEDETTEDPSKPLRDFLKKYADKIKDDQNKHYEEVPVIIRKDGAARNKLANVYLGEEEPEFPQTQYEKPKAWNGDKYGSNNEKYGSNNDKYGSNNEKYGSNNDKYGSNNDKYGSSSNNNKNGWVSLEAVPWSVSKISKWQHKPNQNDRDSWEANLNSKRPNINWSQKNQNPSFDYASQSGQYNQKPFEEDLELSYEQPKPFKRPYGGFQHGGSQYGGSQHGGSQHGGFQHDGIDRDFSEANQWNNRPFLTSNHDKQEHNHGGDCNKHSQSPTDIITDGLPPNFPKHKDYNQQQNNRRQGVATSENLPESHPFNGNGQWILLSNTKGYKYPRRSGERSMQFEPESIGTHRAVRLTVLPPLKNSNVNMTTSHGGLLQVEQTFQTVEQSQRAFVKRQKLKRRRSTKRPLTTTKPLTTKPLTAKPLTTKPLTTKPLTTKPFMTTRPITEESNNHNIASQDSKITNKDQVLQTDNLEGENNSKKNSSNNQNAFTQTMSNGMENIPQATSTLHGIKKKPMDVGSSYQQVKLQNPVSFKKGIKQQGNYQGNNYVMNTVVPTAVTSHKKGVDSSAVLAAVGAGMIPATMAMLVPMAMGGRRRRDLRFLTTDPSLQVTLPRYF